MIVHLVDKAKLREKRLHFYQDPVFLIAIDEVKGLLGSLNLIDLFSSADVFAHYLVKNGIADRELLELEIEDLKVEIESDIAPCADREKQGEKDLFLLLTITFLKLCAMRITHPAAESIARVFVSFCMKYEGYYKLLNRLNCKELKLIQEARLPSILKYELQSIQEEKPPVVEAMPVIEKTGGLLRISYPRCHPARDSAAYGNQPALRHDVYGAGGEAEGFMPPEISTRVACRWRRGDEQVCESRSEQRGGRRHGNTGITY